jgi:hypothetical protein
MKKYFFMGVVVMIVFAALIALANRVNIDLAMTANGVTSPVLDSILDMSFWLIAAIVAVIAWFMARKAISLPKILLTGFVWGVVFHFVYELLMSLLFKEDFIPLVSGVYGVVVDHALGGILWLFFALIGSGLYKLLYRGQKVSATRS